MASSNSTSDNKPHDDYGPRLNLTVWFLSGLATGFLALRVYCKLWRNKALWWDDHVLVAAWMALLASTSLQSVAVSLGYGRHNYDIPEANFHPVLMWSNAAGFASILAAAWSKTSFAITLLRISSGWIRNLVWVIIITINLVLGASATIQWVQCWPIERLWNPAAGGSCWPRPVQIWANTGVAAYSGLMDIVLALLPWKIIWRVTINKKEKLGALFAMSMGVFAGITSLLKITVLPAIGSNDMVDSVTLLIFGTAESAITIMAASIPILRALIKEGRPSPRRFIQVDDTRPATATRLQWRESDGISEDMPSQKA